MKRDQIRAACQALGLDPDTTISVSIFPSQVMVERAVMTDGAPSMRDGALVTERSVIDVQEVTDDGGDA